MSDISDKVGELRNWDLTPTIAKWACAAMVPVGASFTYLIADRGNYADAAFNAIATVGSGILAYIIHKIETK
jgi:hypothetical protein